MLDMPSPVTTLDLPVALIPKSRRLLAFFARIIVLIQ